MSSGQPNGTFDIFRHALPSSGIDQLKRPSSGGGGGGKRFAVSDMSNTALRAIPTPSYLTPRPNPNGPRYTMGTNEAVTSNPLGLMLGGTTGLPGVGSQQSDARPNTGFGGMSPAALKQIAQAATRVGTSTHIKMPGNAPQIGRSTQGEWGLPSFVGLNASQPAFNVLAPGNANLVQRTNNNLQFATSQGMPGDLEFNGGVPSPNPRYPGTVPNGAGGSPLDVLYSGVSQASVDAITEKRLAEETNATIPHSMIMRPFAPNFSSEDLYGQFVMVYRSRSALNDDDKERKLRGLPSGDASFRHTVMSVTAYNYMMASREIDKTEGNPAAYDKLQHEMPATQVAQYWEMAGLVINDRTLNVKNPEDRIATNGSERLLNRCVAGTARSFNYWGRNALRSNCRLFFILKRVPRHELAQLADGRPLTAEAQRYMYSLTKQAAGAVLAKEGLNANTLYYKLGEKGDFAIVYETDGSGRKLHPSPFQLIPYATDSGQGVPMKAREYREIDGSKAYGVVYEVGATFEPLVSGDVSCSSGSILSVKSLTNAGQLNIAVKIASSAC